jgi:uncharacterized UBP type Zn finger protein
MGFPLQRATQALIETQNRHLAAALDWLEQHPEYEWNPTLSVVQTETRVEQQTQEEELKRAREMVRQFAFLSLSPPH